MQGKTTAKLYDTTTHNDTVMSAHIMAPWDIMLENLWYKAACKVFKCIA